MHDLTQGRHVSFQFVVFQLENKSEARPSTESTRGNCGNLPQLSSFEKNFMEIVETPTTIIIISILKLLLARVINWIPEIIWCYCSSSFWIIIDAKSSLFMGHWRGINSRKPHQDVLSAVTP